MRTIAERLLEASPRKKLLDELSQIGEMLDELAGDDTKAKAEHHYRVIVAENLFLICLSLERIFFLFGLVFGVLTALLLR